MRCLTVMVLKCENEECELHGEEFEVEAVQELGVTEPWDWIDQGCPWCQKDRVPA